MHILKQHRLKTHVRYAYLPVMFFVKPQNYVLEWFADEIKYEVLLDPAVARARLKAGSEEVNEWGVQIIQPVFINEDRRCVCV